MLTVLLPENDRSPALRDLLAPRLPPGSDIRDPDDGLEDLAGRRLLFAVALDEGGCNMAYYRMLSRLRRSTDLLSDSIGACIVTGVGEFYTKDVARDMVFAANQAGCGFLGRPLVEATGSLRNFRTQAQIGGTDEVTAFHAAVAELLSRLDGWEKPAPIRHVLALHASQRATSNTLALWELVKAGLPSAPWPTATGAAIPPASTSASRAAASTAAPWWTRSIPPCGNATPWSCSAPTTTTPWLPI